MNIPPIATVYLTNHCQHQCPHCFLTRGKLLQSAHLDTELVIAYLELLSKNKVFMIALAGGDPFLHPYVEIIIRKILELKMLPLLACNPSKELEANVPLLKELGIKTIQFSLDAPVEADHDRSRGAGSFKSTLVFIEKMAQEGIKSNLSVCITNKNIDQVEAVVNLASQIGVFKLKLVFWEADGLLNDWSVSDEQKVILAKKIAGMQSSRPIFEWVALPDFDLKEGKKIYYSMPELIVSANGDVTSSDFSEIICHIDDAFVVQKFEKYVENKKVSFLQGIISENVLQIDKEVVFYNANLKMKAAAAVLLCAEKYHIFVEDNLPPIMRELSILHEIGHVRTNTLSDIKLQSDADYFSAECAANKWLFENLQDYLRLDGEEMSNFFIDPDFTKKIFSSINSKFYIF